jgi:hypothetical protein
MNVNFVAGIAAVVALFLPALLIIAGRLFTNGSLLALFFYYLLTGLYSLTVLNVITLPELLKQQAAIAFNYLDAPLMLVTLLFFCNDGRKRKWLLSTLGLFLLFEIIIAALFGLDVRSSVYLLGPGTVLVLGFSIYFFGHYGKISIVQGKGIGKTFMLVSILFLYGCFLLLYYLHYLQHTTAVSDVFLVYYISLFIAAIIMSIGLVWILKQARAIRELHLTRKELALFFDK